MTIDKPVLDQFGVMMRGIIREEVPAIVRDMVMTIIQKEVSMIVRSIIKEEVPGIVMTIIHKEVPAIVRTIINQEVPKIVRLIIKDEVPTIVREELVILMDEYMIIIKHGFDEVHQKLDTLENTMIKTNKRVSLTQRRIALIGEK